MSNAALFLDKVYENQTDIANKLNALETESKTLQDSFMQLLHRMWKVQKDLKSVAKEADENCAQLYEHMEEQKEFVPLTGGI
jgi:peptidoglycan hydrolase CwlO-like protein